MNSKKLFIITTTFPFGTKESFIENEINYYGDFDEVYFFPLYAEGEVRSLCYPSNIKWSPVNCYNKYLLVLRLFKYLFKKMFWAELFFIKENKKISFGNLYMMCLMLAQADYFSSQILKEIKKKRLDENSDCYLYSYWMMEHALTSTMISKNVKCKFVLTRAHGYDLYENRSSGSYLPFRKYLLCHLNLVCPISEDGVSHLKNTNLGGDIRLSRLGTIDHGVEDLQHKNSDTFTIVSCSWCVEVKRINMLIESLSMVNDEEIHWIHFGDGPLLEELKSMATSKLNKNVQFDFRGKVPNACIIDFYQKAYVDIFINVSSSEGIPVSIMEAMSFGIPVIATDVGGTAEIVNNDLNGFLVKSDFQIEDLASLIVSFKNMSDEKITNLRRNARSFWEQNYSATVNYSHFFRKLSSL